MINPIRWWLAWIVDFVVWWTKVRPKRCHPKPMKAKRCSGGHLVQANDGGQCGSCMYPR
jgi:hypothetical protein